LSNSDNNFWGGGNLLSALSLSEAWKQESKRWAEWARKPGHDSYWRFHRDQFLELLPPAGVLTVDVGCGEGRLVRDLKSCGHKLVGIDIAEHSITLASEADPEGDYRVADAAHLPIADSCADLVVSFMCLQDVDDLESVIAEIARILQPGKRACLAIVHPLNSAGNFRSDDENSEFVIAGSYLDDCRYSDNLVKDGLEMTFHSCHRSLETYSRALEKAGLLIEAIREHPVPDHAAPDQRSKRWQRLPLFMHIRALKM
jgi:ubiquinone/menaquinone biosynthesis C-methylase UbiE